MKIKDLSGLNLSDDVSKNRRTKRRRDNEPRNAGRSGADDEPPKAENSESKAAKDRIPINIRKGNKPYES